MGWAVRYDFHVKKEERKCLLNHFILGDAFHFFFAVLLPEHRPYNTIDPTHSHLRYVQKLEGVITQHVMWPNPDLEMYYLFEATSLPPRVWKFQLKQISPSTELMNG